MQRARTALSTQSKENAVGIINKYWEEKVRLVGAISKPHLHYINEDPLFNKCVQYKETKKEISLSKRKDLYTNEKLQKRRRMFQVYTINHNEAKPDAGSPRLSPGKVE